MDYHLSEGWGWGLRTSLCHVSLGYERYFILLSSVLLALQSDPGTKGGDSNEGPHQ